MRIFGIGPSSACALLSFALVVTVPARAGDVPDYFKKILSVESATPTEVGAKNILQLNTSMFELYGNAGQIFKKNILASHPIILGLFSNTGGRFILYRPSMEPLEAPTVPIVYQLLKSVGHSTMALSEVVVPYLDSPNDPTWRGALAAYRSRMQSALDGLDAAPMRDDWKPVSHEILQNNIAFMDEALRTNAISSEALQAFAKKQGPLLKKNIAWAAQTQVEHWMDVIGGWKQTLGADWDKTYAASNTIYVTRQNNVLFSVLAQFFPPEAINDRLMLIETISFTTTPDDMLESLTRIISDRSVGAAFFGDYHLMDYELRWAATRRRDHRRRRQAQHPRELPPQVPFGFSASMANADHARARSSRPWQTFHESEHQGHDTEGPGARLLGRRNGTVARSSPSLRDLGAGWNRPGHWLRARPGLCQHLACRQKGLLIDFFLFRQGVRHSARDRCSAGDPDLAATQRQTS